MNECECLTSDDLSLCHHVVTACDRGPLTGVAGHQTEAAPARLPR